MVQIDELQRAQNEFFLTEAAIRRIHDLIVAYADNNQLIPTELYEQLAVLGDTRTYMQQQIRELRG